MNVVVWYSAVSGAHSQVSVEVHRTLSRWAVFLILTTASFVIGWSVTISAPEIVFYLVILSGKNIFQEVVSENLLVFTSLTLQILCVKH